MTFGPSALINKKQPVKKIWGRILDLVSLKLAVAALGFRIEGQKLWSYFQISKDTKNNRNKCSAPRLKNDIRKI